MTIEIKLLSVDEDVVAAAAEPLALTALNGSQAYDAPSFMPGATGGWWEFVVDVGLPGMPISVLASLIAAWIYAAMTHAARNSADERKPPILKIIVREHDRTADVEVNIPDKELIAGAIKAALDHVHRDG